MGEWVHSMGAVGASTVGVNAYKIDASWVRAGK